MVRARYIDRYRFTGNMGAVMTSKQKITLRMSEVRERLNEIAAIEGDDFTDEIRSESETLGNEYKDLETRYRAAVIAEAEEEANAAGQFGQGDGESAEIRGLLDRVSLADYLAPASGGVGLAGAAAELNAALKVPVAGKAGGVSIPWNVLEVRQDGFNRQESGQEGEGETRAFTTTMQYAGGVAQRPILQRLFGMDIMDALGVRIDSVPEGRTEWPLITGGVAPNMKAEGTAADAAVAATFDTETLKAKRLTGKYEYTHEQAAQVTDLEQALRRDLADAVRAKMNDLILNGDEETNAQEPDGFLTVLDAATAPGNESTFDDYAGSHAQGVDGIHASMESEVSSVIGVASYRHAATVYQAGSGESGSEALKRRSMKCMASSFIPVPPTQGNGANIQDGNIFHAAGPNGGAMRGDSIAAVWPTLEVIRDIYTQASQGVVLTWVTLWDAQCAFRSGAYRRVSFRVA